MIEKVLSFIWRRLLVCKSINARWCAIYLTCLIESFSVERGVRGIFSLLFDLVRVGRETDYLTDSNGLLFVRLELLLGALLNLIRGLSANIRLTGSFSVSA